MTSLTGVNNVGDMVDKRGAFKRPQSAFRNWIRNEEGAEFPAETGRYHIYISHACPWAHRTMIVRAMKGLEDAISVSAVHYILDGQGWRFKDKQKDQDWEADEDPINNFSLLKEVYFQANDCYEGRFTVPVLYDKVKRTIVNNESSEIIQMLNSEFNAFAKNPSLDLYPTDQKAKVDEINEWVYDGINNGVYKSGFARSQEAYEEAVFQLYDALDRAEDLLSQSKFLAGPDLTLADVRLFTTLVRFDPVYVNHFKCNIKLLREYPNLWAYTRHIFQVSGVSEVTDLRHIKNHYFMSHGTINPLFIVPAGPCRTIAEWTKRLQEPSGR